MASFNNLTLTYSGIQLIHQLISSGGKPLVFTRLGLGDGELADETMIPEMTALINERIRIHIETLEHHPDKLSSCLTARVSTSDLEEDLFQRELGIFALNQDGNEVLLAYGHVGEKYDHIPAAGSNVAITKLVKTFISFAPLDTFYKDLPSDLLVTHTAFEGRIQQILPSITRDSVQEAIFPGDAMTDNKANTVMASNALTKPLDDNHLVNALETRGLNLFMLGLAPSYGWTSASATPYLVQNQTVTGTPRDLYMLLSYPAISKGQSNISRRIVNLSSAETNLGFNSYMLPHVAFFPFTAQQGFYLRTSISRAIPPNNELPENDDVPCFQPVTGPENAIGKFWIEILLPNAGTVYTNHPVLGLVREGRVKLNYIGDDTITPILETYPIQIPTETVFHQVIARCFIIVRDPDSVSFANRKTRIYLVTSGSHQTTQIPHNRMRIFQIAEFRAWTHYAPQPWYHSIYQDGSPRDFDRYGSPFVLEQPKFFADSSFSAWIQSQSIDIRDNG